MKTQTEGEEASLKCMLNSRVIFKIGDANLAPPNKNGTRKMRHPKKRKSEIEKMILCWNEYRMTRKIGGANLAPPISIFKKNLIDKKERQLEL